MESNIRGNAKDITSLKEVDAVAEPYVGMPIYLDDNFFSLLGKGPQCPISDNGDMMDVEIDEDIKDVEGMPEQYMPGQCPMPGECPMPEPCPVQKPCPMPEPCPVQKPCPMPEPCPVQKPCPMPEPCPVQKPCPMPGECPMPSQGTMPGQCPMPSQGTMPGQCPMPSEGSMRNKYMPDRCMPDKYMPDRRMPDKYMPDRRMQDRCMPDRCMPDWCMPDQVMGDYTEIKPGYILNDCAAGCPLAMAYVPWQSWENTYEDEVAFKVGTVFPSLDLPFLGGKRK